MSDDVQRFLSNLPKWTKFIDGFRLPATVDELGSVLELEQRLANVRRRLRDGPQAPLRIAFFGPTGAGKSKLFGSLIGDNFSGSGFKRPFTRESFYYVHDSWQPLVAALEGEVSVHTEEKWKDIILIDTPDFDSVEERNRIEAERVFLECDGFLFVTDALKYADASTWEYLKKIHAAGKAFAVILNKVKSDTVSESFRERFERTLTGGGTAEYTEVIVPEFRIDDATLIEADHESMQKLRNAALNLLSTEGIAERVTAQRLTEECEALCDHAHELGKRIESRRAEINAAKRELAKRAESSKRRLESRLRTDLEPAVRQNVYDDVLKRLEKIDLLRYPRQLLSMPINGLRTLVTGWWTGEKVEASQPKEQPAFADPVSSETFHLLESELISFADQSRNDISARAGLENLIGRDTFKELRYDHAGLKEIYIEHHERFANWVAKHAEETAAEITTENKAKFVLSQVLFNGVMVSSLYAIGGGFGFFDFGASGVVSPMVAKGISMAIGNEKVKEFEDEARREHQRSLEELVDRARERFSAYLDESVEGLDDLEENLREMSESRSQIPGVALHFQGIDPNSTAVPQKVAPDADASDFSPPPNSEAQG